MSFVALLTFWLSSSLQFCAYLF